MVYSKGISLEVEYLGKEVTLTVPKKELYNEKDVLELVELNFQLYKDMFNLDERDNYTINYMGRYSKEFSTFDKVRYVGYCCNIERKEDN